MTEIKFNPAERSSEVHHPVHQLISGRRSTRAYSSKPVESEKIYSLFEAVRWSPSSSNEQPWIYLYATRDQKPLWDLMIESLEEGNKAWAANAPLLILSMARKNFIRNGKENHYAMYDTGAANSALALQAVELGLQARQMAGFKPEVAIKNLNIPEGLIPAVFIAVGYPGDVDILPEPIKLKETSPRVRFIQQEFVRNESF